LELILLCLIKVLVNREFYCKSGACVKQSGGGKTAAAHPSIK